MRFTAKTEQQIHEENLIPAGTYDFEVLDAINKTSRAGNEMIEVTLKVFVDDRERQLRDWLLDKFPLKLRHACEVMDLMNEYESGELNALDLPGRTGMVKIGVRPDQNGLDQNTVQDYVTRDLAPPPARTPRQRQAAAADRDLNDEIPF